MAPVTTTLQQAAQQITEHIRKEALKQQVLFLVSGGSATELAAVVASDLDTLHFPNPITVAQVDERYGEVGHEYSNWKQFSEQCGELTFLKTQPILTGEPFEKTVSDYKVILKNAANSYAVALFGVGKDYHTAGILPESPAAHEETKLVVGFQGPDFLRVTIAPPFFPFINQAFLYAVGGEKLPMLESLSEEHDPVTHPVQFLKNCQALTIFHTP